MATFHFELVSPEKISFSGEVDQVDVPGAEGDFGVLAGHAPLIALAAARHHDGASPPASRPSSSCSAASPKSARTA